MKIPAILAPIMKHRTVAITFAVLPLLFMLLNISGLFTWKCPFFELFHIQCCGCGMTRAINAFVRGDFHEALLFHPFSFILVPFGILWIITLFIPEKKREIIIQKIEILEHKTGFPYIILLFFICFGLVRLIFQIYD